MPSEAEELWRYSGIDRFDLSAFAPVGPTGGPGDAWVDEAVAAGRAAAETLGPYSALVVSVNGTVRLVEHSPGTPGGLVRVTGAGPVAEELAEVPAGAEVHDAFGLLHQALVADVVVVGSAKGAVLEHPVVVVHVVVPGAGGDAPGPAVFPSLSATAGASSSLGVVELSVAAGPWSDEAALVVPVSRLEVSDGARLAYANLQLLGHGTRQVALHASRVGRDATLESLAVGLGGAYARVSTDSDLVGTGGRTVLLAAYVGIGEQVHDFRTLQDHHAAHTDSELLFTGAVADQARSVYSGLIRIRRGARRSDARQTNRNLVLSEGAHADSVPNLDIDENDVRCSHASTVGPIDEEQRYYLESRGVEPALSERLIVLGFFADLAARSPLAGLGAWVQHEVERRLTGRLPAERETVGASAEGGPDG